MGRMRNYLAAMTLSAVLVVAATAALAWFVDPYAYWNTPTVDGVNRYRPASGKHLVHVKLRQYARLKPATLIAGNSRVDAGIDPASAAWPGKYRPVYNLGLPGQGTEGVVAAIETAMAVHRPGAIFVGVDFVDFRISEADWNAGQPAPPPAREAAAERLALYAKLLMSLDALTDTAAALVEQHKRFPADITPRGYNGLGEYNAIVAAEGHAALFAQRNQENLKAYMNGPKQVRWGSGVHPEFAALQRLAAAARQQGTALTLFTYPYHADLLSSFEAAGLWPAFEDWTRDLAAFSARTGVPVHVFTRLDAATEEAVPAPGDRAARMRWYWEGGHFKSTLGDTMIAGMTAGAPGEGLLTPANAETYLAGLKAGLARYRAGNAAGAARIAAARSAAMK